MLTHLGRLLSAQRSISLGVLGRAYSSTSGEGLLRFCVVGSGPSGFYTVDRVRAVLSPPPHSGSELTLNQSIVNAPPAHQKVWRQGSGGFAGKCLMLMHARRPAKC